MNVAFIPVFNDSDSTILNNNQYICDRPLIYWGLKAACECKYIDVVYAAIKSNEIGNLILMIKSKDSLFDKVQVIDQNDESALDTASTEIAMLEFADAYDFDNIALIQGTSLC